MGRWIDVVLVVTAIIVVTFSMEARAADVPFLSGGAGASEREELRAKENEYNLKIVAAEKFRDYLVGVKVVIESAGKEWMLETPTEGPILLVKLSPGTLEGLLIGAKAGIDLRILAQIVPVSAGASRSFDNIPRSVLGGTFTTGGTLDVVAKDLHLACELAREMVGLSRTTC